jgi:carboxylesterase type B
MPRAKGLFGRAIAQSGGAHQAMSVDAAQKVRRQLAQRLGVEPTRDAFSAVTIDRLLRAQAELKADLMAHPDPERWGREVVVAVLPWQPVVDGVVVPARPIDRILAGAGADVDLVTGSTTEESNFFLIPSNAIEQITPESLAATMAGYGLPVAAALATYRSTHPEAGAGKLFSAIQGDWLFRIPALRLAEAHAKSSPATYMYEFAWRSPQFDGRLGACHGADVAFVFDDLDQETEALAGSNPPQHLADRMHAAWIAFARSGNPGWAKYDRTRRATMHFDTKSEVVDDPQSIERILWAGIR